MWEGMVLATTPGTLDMKQAMRLFPFSAGQYRHHWLRFIAQLEENVGLAREFTRSTSKQMAELSEKAQPSVKASVFFRFYERA